MRVETAFEKSLDAIFAVTILLSAFCYLTQAYLTKRLPLSFPHLERFVTYLSCVMMPYAGYQIFLYFHYAGTATRLVSAFLALLVVIGTAAGWWNSRNKTSTSQS